MDFLLNFINEIPLSTKVSIGIALGLFLLGIILSELDRRRGVAKVADTQNHETEQSKNPNKTYPRSTKIVIRKSVSYRTSSNSDDEFGIIFLLGLAGVIIIGALIYFAEYLAYVKQAVTWGSIAFLASLMLMRHIQRNKYTKDALRRITVVRLVASVVNWAFLKFLSQHLDRERNLSFLHIADAAQRVEQPGEAWIPKLARTGFTFITSGEATSLFAFGLAIFTLTIFGAVYIVALHRVATATLTYKVAHASKRSVLAYWVINFFLVGASAALVYTSFDSGAMLVQQTAHRIGENISKIFDSLF